MSSPTKVSVNSKYSGSQWGITPKFTVYAVVLRHDDKLDLVRVGKLKSIRYTRAGYDTSFVKPVKCKGFNFKLQQKSTSSTSDPDGTWFFFREDEYQDDFVSYSTKWKANTELNDLFKTRRKKSGMNGMWLKSYFNTEGQETQDLDVSTDYAKSPSRNTNPQAFSIQPRVTTGGKSPRLPSPSPVTASQLCADLTTDTRGTCIFISL